jgi:GTP-binding protein HflX
MALIERHRRETVILVGVAIPPVSVSEAELSLEELAALADTAGADEADRVLQRRSEPDAATFVGKGKAEELRDLSNMVDADTVIFDDELSPAQSRNLEKILGRTAIDRTALILDIFAQHAHTQEGKAQVELAQLRYRLPRLRGRGITLSQQAGRIGTRGPGETQLEVDRRRLVRRVTKLESDLKELRKNRRTQRKARARSRLPTVTIVGYTNAGKSTLLNRLTDAGVLVQDRLFAASGCWSPTPSGSCASCPTSWSRPSAPPSTRWPRPTCWSTSSTPPRPTRRPRWRPSGGCCAT